MAIKLIALDIDGTLTNQLHTVSPRNIAAIQKAKEAGLVVTLATGRGCIATKPIWQQTNLHGSSIQYGGAMIVDIDSGRIEKLHALDPAVIRDVLDFAAEQDVPAQIYVDETVILEQIKPSSKGYIGRHNLPYIIDPDIRKKDFRNVPKILAFASNGREEALFETFRERFGSVAQVSRSNPVFIEINCLGVTKASALEELSGQLGIDRSEVCALGDNFLDREMIEWAGLGVCMEDGAEEVKAVADLIVPPCDEDGVAYFIEHYALA
ncbi:MAG: Cof-type HAD-IIB family hydrolase [Christensenella sp.]|nr:Cof-type HAD-IIB family hydrolase [Christensenella sp.]